MFGIGEKEKKDYLKKLIYESEDNLLKFFKTFILNILLGIFGSKINKPFLPDPNKITTVKNQHPQIDTYINQLLEQTTTTPNSELKPTETLLTFFIKKKFDKIVKQILNIKNMDPNIPNGENKTPLEIACELLEKEITKKQNLKNIINYLIVKNANPNPKPIGLPPICYVYSEPELVNALINHGANILTECGGQGETPLLYYIEKGNSNESYQHLLKNIKTSHINTYKITKNGKETDYVKRTLDLEKFEFLQKILQKGNIDLDKKLNNQTLKNLILKNVQIPQNLKNKVRGYQIKNVAPSNRLKILLESSKLQGLSSSQKIKLIKLLYHTSPEKLSQENISKIFKQIGDSQSVSPQVSKKLKLLKREFYAEESKSKIKKLWNRILVNFFKYLKSKEKNTGWLSTIQDRNNLAKNLKNIEDLLGIIKNLTSKNSQQSKFPLDTKDLLQKIKNYEPKSDVGKILEELEFNEQAAILVKLKKLINLETTDGLDPNQKEEFKKFLNENTNIKHLLSENTNIKHLLSENILKKIEDSKDTSSKKTRFLKMPKSILTFFGRSNSPNPTAK